MIEIIAICLICGIVACLFYRQYRINQKLLDMLTKLAEQQVKLAQREEPSDDFEARLTEARLKVFNEWLENVVNYDPYKTGGDS